ncbi:S8 family peptidase [Thermococcus zilligii]|uniref:S8 family peptidase n=1 Tax=Thermococcus zilligii TaxID=54076 RepID=UPI00029AE5EB|nr:S8 family serine peptidase [Thermococcus zilligii]
MNRKTLSVLIVLIMALAVVPVTTVPAVSAGMSTQTNEPSNKIMPVEEQIEKFLSGDEKEVRLIIAPSKSKAMEVYNEIAKIGEIDPISKPQYQFIVATIPRENLAKLKGISGIIGIWKDEMVTLPEPAKEPEALPPKEAPQMPDMFLSIFTTRAYDAWVNYGVFGEDVVVAVLDTGIDVGHPFLQQTLDGRRKIIDIYDASDEGIAQLYYATNKPINGTIVVNMTVPVYWGAYAAYYGHPSMTEYNMTAYYVGNIAGSEYYLGLLPERYFDLNNFNGKPYDPYNFGLFGDLSDVYPVLVVNQGGNFVAYIDLNLNNDFTDDQPMTLYDITGDYVTVNTTKVNIALARVHIGDMSNDENPLFTIPYGPGIGYAMFMWDAHGHGTHVSGTVAGVGLPDDPVFSDVYGMAPNAQLIEVKVLPGVRGFGRTSWIINGMFYAALKGADVISMSLGGGGEINDGLESPGIFYANMITDLFGVTFAIAAGNAGPTTNTVHAPGNSDLVITVGAFRSSERWKRFYKTDGVADTVASFSSRGPRMDGLLDPDVIAPGEMIFSSLPLWNTVRNKNPSAYYGIWDGTSMATPHVSGAVALMISYAKQHNLPYNPIMIKRALEMSAVPVPEATPVDQGFGLIQVDGAIAVLQNLSGEKTTYIYGGTTFTGFKNALGKKEIPISPYYIEYNSYFYGLYDLPYLYRGVYIRNEFPAGVPLYFYPMEYENGYGFFPVLAEKAYRISTSDDWIIPNVDTVIAGGETFGSFSIQIDYSRLQPGHLYVGFVYIDDPETSCIDDFIPVIVDLPMNMGGQNKASLSDTALSGATKHYFYQVAPGTKELRVTLRVPLDENGVAMGRTTLMIARPKGAVVASYVPGYYFVGPGLPEYTWVIKNPEPGTWEITAYTSTYAKARTGYNESHYTISVETVGVTIQPERMIIDTDSPGVIRSAIKVKNTNYGTFQAELYGLGMGRLDQVYGMVRSVSQDKFDVIGVIPITGSDYYLRVGITQPEDPNADLDLYVYYFPTYDDLKNFANYIVYTDQIGPASDEVFEKFMPEPGYYLIAVHGYDTAGYNPIHYVFYYQILGDNGDIKVSPSTAPIVNNSITYASVSIKVNESGTYLGVIGVKDSSTGEVLDYAPVIIQVGLPKMVVIAYAEREVIPGEPTKIRVLLLDAQNMTPIMGESTVIVNGEIYYTNNGILEFYYIPRGPQDTLRIRVINPNYEDAEKTFTLGQIDTMSRYQYWKNLYEGEIQLYENLTALVQSAIPEPTRTMILNLAGKYHNRAVYYYEEAQNLLNVDPNRAAYYMKLAYTYENKANKVLQTFLERFG